MDFKVAIIGLGYVGLPLAVEAGKLYPVVGYDISPKRIKELNSGIDKTGEVEPEELRGAPLLQFTSEPADIAPCNFYIVTVPTPVDNNKKPDLSLIAAATDLISSFLKPGDIVVYESTVYPGCTEEFCVPILERNSGLTFNRDFFCGYSPERINPGDKVHRLINILKVTSGSTPQTAALVNRFYGSFIKAGTYQASSIKVAEAAKVIENSQRDINIAFVNELSLIFEKMEIDTREVLEAAATKWNFLKFTPGLVGGHCIGVDPFYLTYKAEELGYHPQVILSGRKINDSMGAHVAQMTLKLLSRKKKMNEKTSILILGITFKENCPDVRNSKAVDIYHELLDYGLSVSFSDPYANSEQVMEEYGIGLVTFTESMRYDAIIVAVAHDIFSTYNWAEIRRNTAVIFDVKGFLDRKLIDLRL